MSKIADTEANATSLDSLVNDNALVPTLRNGPKPSYQYLVDGWNTEIDALTDNFAQESAEAFNEFDLTLEQYKESRGFNTKGTFADGFTYELPNDVGLDTDGNPWILIDTSSLPVIVSAGTTPTNPPYKQVAYGTASQVSTNTDESVQDFIDSFALKIFQSPTDGGLTEIQTRTVDAGEVYRVRKTSDDSLATIYSNAAGTTEIVQNGTSNVSDSAGIVEFYIVDGDYTITINGASVGFRVGITAADVLNVGDLKNGNFQHSTKVRTLGYTIPGDNGAAEYLIKTAVQASSDGDIIDEVVSHTINNGNVAVIQPKNGVVLLEQGGVKIDGSTVVSGTDVESVFEYCFSSQIPTISSGGGTLILSSVIDIYQKFGNDSYKQTFDGTGLIIQKDGSFIDDYIIRVGGSDVVGSFSLGRNFIIEGLTINGVDRAAGGIHNQLGQEFTYRNIVVRGCHDAIAFLNVYYGSVCGGFSKFENNNISVNFLAGYQVSNVGFTDIKFNGAGAGTTDIANCILANTLIAGVSFSNCTFENFGHCLYTDTTVNHAGLIRLMTFERCYFESHGDTLFYFLDGTQQNSPYGLVIQNCFFNESVHALIECYGGQFIIKGNSRSQVVKVTHSIYRFHMKCDYSVYVEYPNGLPISGGSVIQRIESWEREANVAYNPLGNTNTFPNRINTLPSFNDENEYNTVYTDLNNKVSRVYPAQSLQHRDIFFYDHRKSIVLRDEADPSQLFKIKVVDGAVVAKPLSLSSQYVLSPRIDSFPARELYQNAKFGTPPDVGVALYAEELNQQITWDGNNLVRNNGSGEVYIGTFNDFQSSPSPYVGSSIPIYNMDIDEVWNTNGSYDFIEEATNTRKSGTTAQRPASVSKGYIYYDRDVAGYVQWDGSAWNAYVHTVPWTY